MQTIDRIIINGQTIKIVLDSKAVLYKGSSAETMIEELIQRGEILPNGKVKLRILFIGNSLTQDAVSYLPLVLHEFSDYIDYKIYLFYRGGATLSDIYTNKTAQIFSVCNNSVSWVNTNNVSLDSILSTYNDFTIVSLQEYFNYKRTTGYTQADKVAFNNLVNYIADRHNGDFEVYSFWHRPLNRPSDTNDSDYALTDQEIATKIFNLTRNGIMWQLGTTDGEKNTASKGIIPCGIAAYRAMAVEQLDSLGSHANHHMTSDGTHAQEGLPCLMQAWVLAQWVFNKLGLPFSCADSMVRCTASIINTLDVPGGNGTMIAGTEDQNRAANSVAVNALLEGLYVEANGLANVPFDNE